MALNGSEWMNDPWGTSFSAFTDMFEQIMSVGGAFFLVPIVVLCYAIYVKTENPVMVAMFMIASGALFSAGNLFTGNTEMSIIFTVFTALGITGLIGSLLYQKR